MDVLYLSLLAALFFVTLGLVRALDRLGKRS